MSANMVALKLGNQRSPGRSIQSVSSDKAARFLKRVFASLLLTVMALRAQQPSSQDVEKTRQQRQQQQQQELLRAEDERIHPGTRRLRIINETVHSPSGLADVAPAL